MHTSPGDIIALHTYTHNYTMAKRATKKRKASKRTKKWIQKAVPPSHEGRFTAWSKRHGYSGTTGGSIRAGLASKNAHVRHMAQFAANVRKF